MIDHEIIKEQVFVFQGRTRKQVLNALNRAIRQQSRVTHSSAAKHVIAAAKKVLIEQL